MTSACFPWADWVFPTRYYSIRTSNTFNQAVSNLAMVPTVFKFAFKQIWLITG